MATSHWWRTRWILGAAAVAVAAGVLAWALGTAPTRAPVHFWVRTGDPGYRAYTAPDGDEIRGWTVRAPLGWDIVLADRRVALPAGRASDDAPWSLEVVSQGSRLRTWLRAIRIDAPEPPTRLARRWRVPATESVAWAEFVDNPGRLPADAVPDALLAGVWQATSDNVIDGLGDGDRCTLWANGNLSYGDDPANQGCGRWGRIGDVVYLDWRPIAARGAVARASIGTRCDTLIIAPDLRSLRGASTRGHVISAAAVRVR